MRRAWTVAGLALAAVLACGQARAGAWPTPVGETRIIIKAERASADEAFDASGERVATAERFDEQLSLFAERGLTRRLTLQGRLAWARGAEAADTWSGRGPVELGLRYALIRDDRSVVSLYLGGVLAGQGRNAGYAPPGAGGTDLEARLLAGRSFSLAGRPGFAEVQAARLDRSGLPDETRLDLTLGVEPSDRWLLLLQAYSGRAEGEGDPPAWLKLEVSAARRAGPWRLQAGWRTSAAGVSSPVEQGPVLALWRTF